jgi:hypothetical protein
MRRVSTEPKGRNRSIIGSETQFLTQRVQNLEKRGSYYCFIEFYQPTHLVTILVLPNLVSDGNEFMGL